MIKTIAAMKRTKDWIAERPADREISAGKMVSILIEAITIAEAQSAEPVLWQFRTMPNFGSGVWHLWIDCSKESAADYAKTPVLHDWLYEVRELFAKPPIKQSLMIDMPAFIYQGEDICGDPVGPATAYYTKAQPISDLPTDCTRSHPHENMSPMCELRTEITRLTFEARQPAADLTDDEIVNIAIASKGAEPGRDGYILPITFGRAILAAQKAKP